MKKTTIVFIVLYLILFVLAGWWFYNKYFHKITTSNEVTQSVDFNKNKTIFYTQNNNLYLLNAENLNKSVSEIGTFRLQSTGQVQTVNFDQNNQFVVYDTLTPQDTSEIWKVSLSDNHSEKIFANQIPGFENYSNFRNPKMSKTGHYMTFIASNSGIDDIFVWNIDQNSVQNLTNQTIKEKISAVCWSYSEPKIYFASESGTGGWLKLIDLSKNIQDITSSASKFTRIESLSDRLIASTREANGIINLNYILSGKTAVVPITDLVTPKTLKGFDISPDGKKIVYQAGDTATDDLYLVNIDGSNLLQLTTDGKSQYGIFSPESDKIAYWINGSGIYTLGLSKKNPQKLLNENKIINNLVLWR